MLAGKRAKKNFFFCREFRLEEMSWVFSLIFKVRTSFSCVICWLRVSFLLSAARKHCIQIISALNDLIEKALIN